jgi:4-amino-4-deoxychorismate lyase
MCRLLETIKVEHNQMKHIPWHNARVNYSRSSLLGMKDRWDLENIITVPDLDNSKIYRCRFIYSKDVESIEYIPYIPRKVETLYLVYTDTLDYSFKFADRKQLESLKNAGLKANEDILIIKDHCVTDTSFSNIVFFDGIQWVTPDKPLLLGTKRAFYLQTGKIIEKRIQVNDLQQYHKARLINAMLDLETGEDIRINRII